MKEHFTEVHRDHTEFLRGKKYSSTLWDFSFPLWISV